MRRVVFLAGAAGAIGRRLTPLLLRHGFAVIGTTRSKENAAWLEARGATPVIVDVFDSAALLDAVCRTQPEIVIHQLTDLPAGLDPLRMIEAVARNARIRREGTANLAAAAVAAHSSRLIAQSIAWAYAPGNTPHFEADPLDLAATPSRAVTVLGVAALEHAVLDRPEFEGIVLRYARIYGPGTGAIAATDEDLSVHVDAAAYAAWRAIDHGRAGAYNIAETESQVDCGKARLELDFDAAFRLDDAP